jgi:D-tyrosyl-tRNA(Tyr) deacylase
VITLIQRVSGANIVIDGEKVAEIGFGLVALVGVERADGLEQAQKLAERLVAYRVFEDDAGKMNRSVREVGGSLLLVPQFTLVADTRTGLRPSFSRAAPPEQGATLFAAFARAVAAAGPPVACGRFGAHMQVSLTNDGPVTFWLQVPPAPAVD